MQRQMELCRLATYAVQREGRRTMTGDGVVREFAGLPWRNHTVGDWAERAKRGQFGVLEKADGEAVVLLECIVGQPPTQKTASIVRMTGLALSLPCASTSSEQR
jgi:hypothetical protein